MLFILRMMYDPKAEAAGGSALSAGSAGRKE